MYWLTGEFANYVAGAWPENSSFSYKEFVVLVLVSFCWIILVII